jgi:hypothetical protein
MRLLKRASLWCIAVAFVGYVFIVIAKGNSYSYSYSLANSQTIFSLIGLLGFVLGAIYLVGLLFERGRKGW